MASKYKELLKKVSLFSLMSDDDLSDVESLLSSKTYAKNEMIFMEDDEGSKLMFIIVSGKVKVSITGISGKETILAILNEKDYFGEMSLIDGEPRSASVQTLDKSVLLILHRNDLFKLIERQPKLSLSMLVEFSRRLRIADKQISNLSLLSVFGKIAGTLLSIGSTQGKYYDGYLVVEKMPTHQEIASMAGTTRETVTRVLSSLQDQGLITINKKRLTIKYIDELEEKTG